MPNINYENILQTEIRNYSMHVILIVYAVSMVSQQAAVYTKPFRGYFSYALLTLPLGHSLQFSPRGKINEPV